MVSFSLFDNASESSLMSCFSLPPINLNEAGEQALTKTTKVQTTLRKAQLEVYLHLECHAMVPVITLEVSLSLYFKA